MNEPFITLADIRALKSISLNVNSEKELLSHILEAQEFDLRIFMGEEFYLDLVEDILANPSLVKYSDLWEGQNYTYNDHRYQHSGLKTILCYHTYARYVGDANFTATATGIVIKTNPYSEKADEKTIGRKITQARSGATAHEERVKMFLDRNYQDFPLWKCAGRTTNYKSGFKVRKIG